MFQSARGRFELVQVDGEVTIPGVVASSSVPSGTPDTACVAVAQLIPMAVVVF